MSGSFVGKITAAGYEPPDGTMVNWTRFGKGVQSYPLRKHMQWSGSNVDSSFHARYAMGRSKEVEGLFIREVGVEQQGGEAFAILAYLRGAAGHPGMQEVYDFAIANGNGRVLTAEDWPRLTGRPSPIQQPPIKPDPPKVDPKPPVNPTVLPPVVGLAPLSPASRRADEVRQMVSDLSFWLSPTSAWEKRLNVLAGFVAWPMVKPFAVEALRMWRLLRRRAGDMRELPKEDR